MKPSLLITWTVCQLLYLVAIYYTLNAGIVAQRTHNYSILRELETKGQLNTNSSLAIEPGQPGHGFYSMKPMRASHTICLALSFGWMLISIALLIVSMKSKPIPDNHGVMHKL